VSILVPVALIGFPVFALLVWFTTKPVTACSIILAAGWCFLPMSGYAFQGLPDYDKISAANYVLLLLIGLFGTSRLTRVRWHWVDLLFLGWLVAGAFSSFANGLGAYDAASNVFRRVVEFGAPYLAGRIFCRDDEDLGRIVRVIIVFGLLYVPLVLYEGRMSPQLHRMVYGFFQHSFGQVYRFGGWRPTVFMAHGLQVALWMTMAFLLALGLALLDRSRRTIPVFGVPIPIVPAAMVLGLSVLLCRSLGAWALAAVGVAILVGIRATRRTWPALGLAAILVAILATRATGTWSGEPIPALAALIDADRAGSFQFRLDNEDILAAKARERPVFGWGGFGRNRVYDESGRDISVTDGWWIIVFGINGTFGLACLYGWLIIPAALALRRPHSPLDGDRLAASRVVLATTLLVAVADTIPNAFPVPIMYFATAGLVSVIRQSGFAAYFGTSGAQLLPAHRETSTRSLTPSTHPCRSRHGTS